MCPVAVISVSRVNREDASSHCLLAKTHAAPLRLEQIFVQMECEPSAFLKVATKESSDIVACCFIESNAFEEFVN